MTAETLKVYGPCAKHRLWHDLSLKCHYCLCEAAAAEPLPGSESVRQKSDKVAQAPVKPAKPQKPEPFQAFFV